MTLHLCVDSASRLSSHLNMNYLEGWKCRISACNLSLCPVAFLSQLLTGWFLPLSQSRQGTELIPLERNWLLGAPQHPSIAHTARNQTVRSQLCGEHLPRLHQLVWVLVAPAHSGCRPWESDSAQSSWLSQALVKPHVWWSFRWLSWGDRPQCHGCFSQIRFYHNSGFDMMPILS